MSDEDDGKTVRAEEDEKEREEESDGLKRVNWERVQRKKARPA